MASTCDVYKGGIKLGSGTCADGSATISSYTAKNDGLSGDIAQVAGRRNVQIIVIQAGTFAGMHWNTMVLTEGASSLTLKDPCPYVGA